MVKNLIFMEPIYKDYIWGGVRLKTELKKNTFYDKVAESWEIAANSNGNCKIVNKEFRNKTLYDLFTDKTIKEEVFGKKCFNMPEFPLLIKFIDANDNLSVQVHPDDIYAQNIGFFNGKSEMWYIMDCDKKSKLIGGLNTKLNYDQLKESINNNNIKKYLNYIDVKKGDCIYIPSGLIHSILKDNLICEIQQNCDITYRVYDWDRLGKDGKPREMHKEEALEVIKSDLKPEVKHTDNDKKIQNIVINKYFKVDKINCNDIFCDVSNDSTFYAMIVVEGKGCIYTDTQNITIEKGNCFLIPSTLGKYKIIGKLEILKVSIV